MALIIDVGLIALFWCTSSLIVNPIGNFPLNDDWAYGLTVKHLLDTGDYHPVGWTSAALITNVLWGYLFCLPAGFSYTALRLSTLFASLFGLIGTYILVRDLQGPRWVALVVTLSLGFNPIYYALSHTFMTDVCFTAIAIWAAVFFARSLKSGSDLQMFIGTLFAVAATLSRQIALCVPLAFALSVLARSPLTARAMLRAAFPLILCVTAFVTFNHWLEMSDRLPIRHDAQNQKLYELFTKLEYLITRPLATTSTALVYLGLFLLPTLVLSAKNILGTHRGRATVLIAAGILVLVGGPLVLAHYGHAALTPVVVPDNIFLDGNVILMPIAGNVLDPSGIGPLTLRDTYVLHLNHMPALPIVFWIAVTVSGLIGAMLLIAKLSVFASDLIPRLLRRRLIGDSEAVGVFLLLCGSIYLLPLLGGGFFDRYLVPTTPFFAAGIVGITGKFGDFPVTGGTKILRTAAFALLAAFSVYAIGSTRDYLAWNRVRWEALQDLMHDGHIDAEEIDGGFEFNGLHFYDPNYQLHFNSDKSWWWVHGDMYEIGFGPVPGYTVIKEYTYLHWLPMHEQKIVVLRKKL